MARAFIALGANIGDCLTNIRTATRRLSAVGQLISTSSIYDTAPEEVLDQPRFLNAVIILETDLAPLPLLQNLNRIESDLGRLRTSRYGPRPIDLDLIYYDDLVVASERLTVPHPRMTERRFVLAPLAEIAPDHLHPTLKLSSRSLLNRLPQDLTLLRTPDRLILPAS